MAKKQEPASPIVTRDVVRRMSIEVSQDDRNAAARDLAEATLKHNLLVDDRTRTVSDFTKRINKQAGVMESLATTVQDGLIEEEVRCVQELDFEQARTRVLKKANGEVVEDWRPMTEAERQLALPGTDDDGDEAAGGEPKGVDIN